MNEIESIKYYVERRRIFSSDIFYVTRKISKSAHFMSKKVKQVLSLDSGSLTRSVRFKLVSLDLHILLTISTSGFHYVFLIFS